MAAKSRESEDSSSSDGDEEGKETPQQPDQTEDEQGILLQGNNNSTSDGLGNDSRINSNVAAQQALMEANIKDKVLQGCVRIRAFNGNCYEPLPGWTTSGQRVQQCTEDNPPLEQDNDNHLDNYIAFFIFIILFFLFNFFPTCQRIF